MDEQNEDVSRRSQNLGKKDISESKAVGWTVLEHAKR